MDKDLNSVVIAADAKVWYRYGPPAAQCKIVLGEQCYFAISGVLAKRAPHFDLAEIGRTACRESGDLRTKVDAFEKQAQPAVTATVDFIRKDDPEYYRKILRGRPAAEIIFAGLLEEHLALISVRYVVSETGRILPYRRELSKVACALDEILSAGENKEIVKFARKHPGWRKQGLSSAARKFIELEIAKHPDVVGPPVSILRIDRFGAHWVEHGACHDELPDRAQEDSQ